MKSTALLIRTFESSRDLCVACIILPCLAFALGVFAVYHPGPILLLSIAAAGLGWLVFTRLLLSKKAGQVSGRIAAALTFGAMSMAQAFGAGMMVAGPGNLDVLSMLFAFGLGLLAAMAYRRHHRDIAHAIVPRNRAAA